MDNAERLLLPFMTINRTIVELKLLNRSTYCKSFRPINRTIVELK